MVRKRRIIAVIAGGAAAAYAVLAVQNQRAADQAEHDHPPAGDFVEIDGARLHYVRQGSGPAVVLLHGNPGSVDDWTIAVLPELAKTHHVIAFDRPGHGHSDALPDDSGSPDAQARAIHDALSALGVERPILVGHSWGGGLILAYALRYPDGVGGLVAVEPSSYADSVVIDPIYSVLATPVIGELFAAAFTSAVGRPKVRDKLAIAFSPDPVPESYVERASAMWTRPSEARATAIDSIRRKDVLAELSPKYPQIGAPMIIIVGDQDRLSDPKKEGLRLNAEVPASELVELPDAGHMLPETRAAEVVAAVRKLAPH